MADKKISELDLALLINNDAVFPMSQDNAGEPTTFKVGITQLGTEIAEDMTFSNLRTTSKKLVGAINELLSLGNPIIIGTTAPTSSQGADGNIYIQYTEGTGGADDEVDGIFVKIDGAWCEISTGGGSGTTDYEDLSNKPQVNSVELVGNKSLDDLGIMPALLSKTVSGSIAHITDGADNIPVKSLVSQIVAVESGNGQPKSPINPYTVSGFDNGVVTRCGKNLLNITDFKDINNWGTTYPDGGSIPASAANPIYSFGKLIAGETYTLSFEYAEPNFPQYLYFGYYDNEGVTTRLAYFTTNQIFNRTYTFTALEDVFYCVRVQGANKFDENMSFINKCQLEFGTATDFKAYNGNTYTFAFGQTVYGGHFDNKGNLVVTHGFIDLGTLSGWSYNSIQNFWQHDIPDIESNTKDVLCEGYNYTNSPWDSMLNYEFRILRTSMRLHNDTVSTSAELETQLNGIHLKYLLANPITLSITSQDIPTLLGENNIFSNCGGVEVNYFTDKADEIVEVAKATASTPLHNYSTDEQVVGTWIDGSTLYEKTIISTSELSKETINHIALGITGIDVCVSVSGFASYGSNNTYIPLPYGDKDNSLVCLMNINRASSVANVWVGSDYTSPSTVNILIITLRYTKSSS